MVTGSVIARRARSPAFEAAVGDNGSKMLLIIPELISRTDAEALRVVLGSAHFVEGRRSAGPSAIGRKRNLELADDQQVPAALVRSLHHRHEDPRHAQQLGLAAPERAAPLQPLRRGDGLWRPRRQCARHRRRRVRAQRSLGDRLPVAHRGLRGRRAGRRQRRPGPPTQAPGWTRRGLRRRDPPSRRAGDARLAIGRGDLDREPGAQPRGGGVHPPCNDLAVAIDAASASPTRISAIASVSRSAGPTSFAAGPSPGGSCSATADTRAPPTSRRRAGSGAHGQIDARPSRRSLACSAAAPPSRNSACSSGSL